MKVLLVNSPVIHVLEPWFDEPNFVRTALAHLAGYLREHADFEVSCLDAKFERLTFVETIERIKDLQPDIIGFTAFTNEIKPSAYLAAKVKKLLPKVTTIIGGAHVTALPEVTLKQFNGFDCAVVGEGEQTLLEICQATKSGAGFSQIRGVAYRDANEIIRNPERPRILDQDSLPMPAWDLMPVSEKYFIQSVRGCPFNCVFCMNHNGKVARKRAVSLVINEMKYLIDRGAKEISFGDELFSVDMARTHLLLDAMIEEKIGEKVEWDIQTHVAFVDDSLLKKMKAAHLTRCEMGVESGDELALKRMGKATNQKMILNSFQLAKKHGITTGSFLLFGQPNESLKTLWKTIQLGIKINPNEPMIGTMVPYPGTAVSEMIANGKGAYKLKSLDWDDYGKQINGSLEFENLSLGTLQFMQLVGYSLIFLANFRFIDFGRFFWQYRIAAFGLVKALVFNSSTAKSQKPDDYDDMFSGILKLSKEDLSLARKNWKTIQSDEVKRTKNLKPELLKEQMPLK